MTVAGTVDKAFLRRMAAQHRQGVGLATLGVERAGEPHLRALARTMVATQNGDLLLFGRWWRSWFGGPVPAPSQLEHSQMPGMLTPNALATLHRTNNEGFDTRSWL